MDLWSPDLLERVSVSNVRRHGGPERSVRSNGVAPQVLNKRQRDDAIPAVGASHLERLLLIPARREGESVVSGGSHRGKRDLRRATGAQAQAQ